MNHFTDAQLESYPAEGPEAPVAMLNLLRFRPDGGREHYMRYVEALGAVRERYGLRPIFFGDGGEALIAEPGQAWDAVAVIRYPNRRAFVEMVRSPEYRAIAHLRPESLVEMVLQPITPVIEPGSGMTIVLVHGNPETDAVWGPLSAALVSAGHPEPVRLSPPGFGAPLPNGFDVTPEGYRAWLARELERIGGEPVDLVGHDWGGIHVVNVAMTRPELIRSWATDAIRAFHPDYVWHALAQIWQQPDAGEAWMERHLTGDSVGELLTARGMDAAVTREVAPRFDATMGDCILQLYRAAAQPLMVRLGEQLEAAAARPGLVFSPEHDLDATTAAQQRAAAARAGAEMVELPAVGHWWLTQPDQTVSAAALTRFWTAVAARAPLPPSG